MTPQQQSLLSESAELVDNRRLRKNILVILQNVGRMDFCKQKYVNGEHVGPGCGVEIYWCNFRGGRPVPLNDDGSRHVCREVKP